MLLLGWSNVMLPRICLCAILSIVVYTPCMLQVADAESPKVDDLAAAVRQETAFHLVAGRRPSNWNILTAGDLGAILNRKGDGVELLSLFDLAQHRQLLAKKPFPLFTLTMRHLESKQDLTLAADAGWEQIRVASDDRTKGIEICWQTPQDKRLKGLRVVAVASLDPSVSAMRWKLSVDQVDKAWSVRRVRFPQVALDMSSPKFTFFYPWGPGQLTRGSWTGAYSGPYLTYPAHCATMQYMAAYDPQLGTGLYCAMHDPQGSTKDLCAEGRPADQAAEVAFDVPAENMDQGGNGYIPAGDAVWQVFHGDWFDAALIYRAWVRQNARWFPKLTAEGRADTPLWMRELPVWVRINGVHQDLVRGVEAFAKALGVPVGVHWYDWHQILFDNDYPHFFPAKEDFVEEVRDLQAKGVFVMPYINGRLWDTRDNGAADFEFSRRALPAATKDEEGKPYIESYASKETDGSPVRFAVMCPATALWEKTVRQTALQLINECQVKAVYIDQVAAERPELCFDHAHGHPTGGGHWWTESYNAMLHAIRQSMPADCALTAECNAEPYINRFDGYLTWFWCHENQVPAFPAVYGGAIQMFGRTYRGGDTKELAFRMKAGQQFTFGEQIGWFGPDVIADQASMAFLRQVVALRWQLRRYFYAGEMARPPKLQGAIPTVRADWQWDTPGWVTTDATMTGAWTLPNERRCILLFTNVSDQPVTAKLQLDAAAYGLQGNQVKVTTIHATAQADTFLSPPAIRRELTLPARSAFAWELTPVGP